MANCPGILNREPRLVGILNNSIINKGGGEATSFIVEDTLQKQKWIKVTEEDKFVSNFRMELNSINLFINTQMKS